jgi:hypothetical protein
MLSNRRLIKIHGIFAELDYPRDEPKYTWLKDREVAGHILIPMQ